jgi:hypothetical protein
MEIKKEDWPYLAPTQKGFAIVFDQQLKRISNTQHRISREEIFNQVEEAYIRDFGTEVPFGSFDYFRKWYNSHLKEIWRKP